MIISASYRTDIPAFYGRWFVQRFRAGFCRVGNPYGGPPSRVSLREGVDGFVFWTRNIGPFLPVLAELRAAGVPFVIHYTVTNYPRPLETSVIEAARSVELIRRLAGEYGPRAVVWRYDPILVTDLTPADWHVKSFSRLAEGLAGATDEVVTSFAQPYRKTARNLGQAARQHGFSWREPPPEEKHRAVSCLSEIAQGRGMRLTLCTQPGLTGEPARCIAAARLSDLAGHPIIAKTKGNRPGCLCNESRDIGAYDSCPHGCVYCYAVSARERAKQRFGAHDPDGEFLFAP